MDFRLALETGRTSGCMAWVLELPGCYLNTETADEVLSNAPEAIKSYLRWLRKHGEKVSVPRTVRVVEKERTVIPGNARKGMTAAFFDADRPPLTKRELETLLRRLSFSRKDLLPLIADLPPNAWKRPRRSISGPMPTIKDQVQHIASVELWYLRKLWPIPRFRPAKTPLERIAVVRETVDRVLRKRAVADAGRTAKYYDELWTPRKVLRRLLYHEPYHVNQISAMLGG